MNWTKIAAALTAINATIAVLAPGSKWGVIAATVVGALATIAGKMAPAGLTSGPVAPLDQLGRDANTIAGEAFEQASKGPFKR